jgi:hypothetical protein
MSQTLFASEEALTPDWLTYIEQEAKSLSQSDEFTIENYADRELLNPDVQSYLMATYTGEEDTADDLVYSKGMNLASLGQTAFALSFEQNGALAGQTKLFGWWKRTKESVRRVFCEVTAEIIGEGKIDWKDIIKAVRVALIPVFAGGIPAIILPIIIALIAAMMKLGYGKVCPVA